MAEWSLLTFIDFIIHSIFIILFFRFKKQKEAEIKGFRLLKMTEAALPAHEPAGQRHPYCYQRRQRQLDKGCGFRHVHHGVVFGGIGDERHRIQREQVAVARADPHSHQ